MLAFHILTGIKIFKLLQIILISAVKFMFAPLISLKMGFSYFQTILYTTIGGILGVLFFFFLSNLIIRLYKQYLAGYVKDLIQKIRQKKQLEPTVAAKPRKKFTKKNRFIIFVKSKFGMVGIIILTPTILSIPIGTFIASKYYSNKKALLIYLSISVAIWSFVLSTIFKLL